MANEYQSGTKLYGCIDKSMLMPYLRNRQSDALDMTQPLFQRAAPGFCYMLIEVLTSGNLNTKHLFVARVGSELDEMKRTVFKLGRDPSCQVTIKQNTISRVQCCLIWKPESNKWSIVDSDTVERPDPSFIQPQIQLSYG